MTSIPTARSSHTRPGAPVADWVQITASARHQRSIYLASLLRSAVAAFTPHTR